MLHEALCTPSYPPPHLLHRTPDTTEFSRVPSSEHASSLLSTQLSRHFYLPSSRRDCESDLRRFILCLAEHQRADELAFLRQHARRLQVRPSSAHAPKLTQLCARTKPPHRQEIDSDTLPYDSKTRPKTTSTLTEAAPGLGTSPAPAAIPQSLQDAEAEYAAAARARALRVFLTHHVPSIHDLQIRRPVLPKLPRS